MLELYNYILANSFKGLTVVGNTLYFDGYDSIKDLHKFFGCSYEKASIHLNVEWGIEYCIDLKSTAHYQWKNDGYRLMYFENERAL